MPRAFRSETDTAELVSGIFYERYKENGSRCQFLNLRVSCEMAAIFAKNCRQQIYGGGTLICRQFEQSGTPFPRSVSREEIDIASASFLETAIPD